MRPFNVTETADAQLEVVLSQISRRVLDDVWVSGRLHTCTLVLVHALAGATIIGWLSLTAKPDTLAAPCWVSYLAVTFFGLTALASGFAVRLRRFPWCCAAAYLGGITTVVGFGVVWWHQTAPPGRTLGPSVWMVIGVLGAAGLTLTWLGVILTPIERSQPDLRVALARAQAPEN
jgi:hypothetical protein